MGKGPAMSDLFGGNMGSMQREGTVFYAMRRTNQSWQRNSNR